MTKEELEKEAVEYTDSTEEKKHWSDETDSNAVFTREEVEQAYLAGAEPREKRIAELEAQIEKMRCCINDLVHLGEFDEHTDEEYLNYQVHEALKNAEQFLKEIEK